MATSKTLKPTNEVIQIPAFADKPDQRANSNCLDKEADAINALYNKLKRNPIDSTDLNNYTVGSGDPDALYYGANISAMTHKPDGETSNFPFTLDVSNNGGYIIQKMIVYSADGTPKYYIRQQYYNSGNRPFGEWAKLALA